MIAVLVLLLLLGGATALAGLVMVWIGATGSRRRDRCHCGYDLRAAAPDLLRCPECGRTGPFVTVRHPKLLTWGIALFLAGPVLVIAALYLPVLLTW